MLFLLFMQGAGHQRLWLIFPFNGRGILGGHIFRQVKTRGLFGPTIEGFVGMRSLSTIFLE
jgi:hypothetical protein